MITVVQLNGDLCDKVSDWDTSVIRSVEGTPLLSDQLKGHLNDQVS